MFLLWFFGRVVTCGRTHIAMWTSMTVSFLQQIDIGKKREKERDGQEIASRRGVGSSYCACTCRREESCCCWEKNGRTDGPRNEIGQSGGKSRPGGCIYPPLTHSLVLKTGAPPSRPRARNPPFLSLSLYLGCFSPILLRRCNLTS